MQSERLPGKGKAGGTNRLKSVTKLGEYKGERTTSALTACREPDRRVKVEVSGAR